MLEHKVCFVIRYKQKRMIESEAVKYKMKESRAEEDKKTNQKAMESCSLSAERKQADENKPQAVKESGITAAGIRAALSAQNSDLTLMVLDSVDSTNTYAKELLHQHGIEKGLIAAREQTAGRGRHGKSFSSVRGNGIYMSLILGVHQNPADFLFITSAAAVAVARVLERVSDETPKIKWVNDIWAGDKKLCGILTEAVSKPGSGLLDYCIIGIGINIQSDFKKMPADVQAVAGTVRHLYTTKDQLIAAVADEVFRVSKELGQEELHEEYRRRSMIIGRDIYWENAGVRKEGRAVDINNSGNLIVETKDGTVVLNSGLISVRPIAESNQK